VLVLAGPTRAAAAGAEGFGTELGVRDSAIVHYR